MIRNLPLGEIRPQAYLHRRRTKVIHSMRRRKFSKGEKQYWMQVLIAVSQITFGLAWASVFLPIDQYKVFVIVLNGVLSVVFWLAGLVLVRSFR